MFNNFNFNTINRSPGRPVQFPGQMQNPMQMMQQMQMLRQQVQDPRAELERMVRSGQISMQQVEELDGLVQQLRGFFPAK